MEYFYFKVTQFKNDGSSGEKKNYKDVASAFDSISDSTSSINDPISKIANNINTNNLNWNEEKGAYDASYNGQVSKITNVANEKVEKSSKESGYWSAIA
ncbi:Uncharacterised protein [Candidatus Bartonella washoeensis]|uniref:Trimeric autotransporter adhesin YadA-like stalk domain-containing protein n=1 Tax=Candidatus Bartonella washoeensis Sb944nv TaxID=1094563 RepID=J0Q9K1_9HYPH|nr:hypothetical protein [Bartonella washoeensis]EJF79379.1 hypothetical protein MCQ_00920 [Bartonella washoeensis Sb944nv]SPU27493.1 Uncharacterised protein [Bartonella washoeensis]